jgi:formylglycine-generating enzyme required for sulfatase activity
MLKLILFMLCALFAATASFAQVVTFEKEVEEIVANDQSREQVEAFALQKAKRLAVEEAGTYISSLTVVSNAMLQKEEISALASGVVQAKIMGLPNVRVENGVIHINVKARIQVDTAVLDRQVAELLKERGTLKKLEEEQRKVRELENRLASLKSTELKRLEELNAQAMVLEMERERRRLANAEMALQAQGELKKAEMERLRKERELQERTARMMADQEAQRKKEADDLARERDRIRRAQLENEQRWNELARKSQLAQQQWVAIDDSLSLKQALAEARTIKEEIVTLKQRSEFQYNESVATLKSAYRQQLAATTPDMPPPLAGKDPFESTAEYNARCVDYNGKVQRALEFSAEHTEKLKEEETLKLALAKVDYLERQIRVLQPFVERLKALQARLFVLPGETVRVELGEPDADRNCFPTTITHNNDRWTVDWKYSDRNVARDIYKTRGFLKAEAMMQLDGSDPKGYVMTEARITHPGTGVQQSLVVVHPRELSEISDFNKASNGELAVARREVRKAKMDAAFGEKFKDPITGMEFLFVEGGCFQMGDTFGDGYKDEKPVHEVCVDDYYMGTYEVTQGEWQLIMRENPSYFKYCGANCPVEYINIADVKEFIGRLKLKSGKNYRLPTEAEWEYAARSGGKREKYSGGDNVNTVAWYNKNSNATHSVGQKESNGLGFYDMSGNVCELCSDRYDSDYYEQSPRSNPKGATVRFGGFVNASRTFRGGCWYSDSKDVRTSTRLEDPGYLSQCFGLRLAFSVQ